MYFSTLLGMALLWPGRSWELSLPVIHLSECPCDLKIEIHANISSTIRITWYLAWAVWWLGHLLKPAFQHSSLTFFDMLTGALSSKASHCKLICISLRLHYFQNKLVLCHFDLPSNGYDSVVTMNADQLYFKMLR